MNEKFLAIRNLILGEKSLNENQKVIMLLLLDLAIENKTDIDKLIENEKNFGGKK